MTAALLAGCADSNRFSDALGNPFHSAAREPAPGATYDREMSAPPPYRPVRTAAVQSSHLAPPSDLPTRRVARYEEPRERQASYAAPRGDRRASISAPSGHGAWSSDGGMAIVAGQGESAGVLAQRYNVPTEVLLQSNGFSSASQIRPGTRLVIPVYSVNGASRVASAEIHHERIEHEHVVRERVAQNRAAAHEAVLHDKAVAHEHKGRERLLAKREAHDVKVSKVEQREEHDARGKMHWVKGAQPVRSAEEGRGREKVMARLDRKKAEKATAVAEAKAARQKAAEDRIALAKAEHERSRMAKADLAKEKHAKIARSETMREKPAVVAAHAETIRERPQKVAKLEEPASKKAAVDPTPTASLPPAAAEKVSANGNPEFRWPAHGRIIQGFKTGGNDGINIAVPDGTAVKAAESGVVAYAGSEIKGFGNLVLIRHPNGYVTAYANNSNLEVHRGEQVKRGQTIAKSGQSGNVASPQLHFELRKGSTPVDPTRYLAGL